MVLACQVVALATLAIQELCFLQQAVPSTQGNAMQWPAQQTLQEAMFQAAALATLALQDPLQVPPAVHSTLDPA